MDELRDGEKVLSSNHMMGYMKQNQREWLDAYLANDHTNDVAAYNSLLRLCERFAHRHGFSMRVPTFAKESTPALLEGKAEFAEKFRSEYGSYSPHEIINVDETSLYFDTPPKRIWAVRGQSSKIDKTQKHSDRITVVVTVRADGKKLPLFFIVKGKPGGWIEKREQGTYPDGHCNAVQANAWMDSRVWAIYVKQCLAPEVGRPSVLLLDNFDAHVSPEGQAVVVEEPCCSVCPLPANATSVCQPLDVGVMGPLKARRRSLWLREESTAKTAKDKRLSMIERTIRAYEGLEAETISTSFEKAIPRPVAV